MVTSNSEKLKRIMRDRGLRPADVAELIGCSIWTVYRWRSGYEMPNRQMELLRLKLAMRAAPGMEDAHV